MRLRRHFSLLAAAVFATLLLLLAYTALQPADPAATQLSPTAARLASPVDAADLAQQASTWTAPSLPPAATVDGFIRRLQRKKLSAQPPNTSDTNDTSSSDANDANVANDKLVFTIEHCNSCGMFAMAAKALQTLLLKVYGEDGVVVAVNQPPMTPRFRSFEVVLRLPRGRDVLVWTALGNRSNPAHRFPTDLLFLAALDRALTAEYQAAEQ
ncbi:hypothetical protein BC831DRAFT_474015 [Entophlyctis helioformis]|nr:hypothetical protein BC831DRAFT_474015 [Entophlyctis helioformis]